MCRLLGSDRRLGAGSLGLGAKGGRMVYFRGPSLLSDVLAAVLAVIAVWLGAAALRCPLNYVVIVATAVIFVAFVLARVCAERAHASEESARAKREVARDGWFATFEEHARVDSEAQERYFKELLARVNLSDLERRALQLVSDISAVTDKFLAKTSPQMQKLQTLNQLRDHPLAISQLGYTRKDVNDATFMLEYEVMKWYREGDYEAKISALVDVFANMDVHDDFTDAFAKLGAHEPYTIINFRDALYRLVAKSSTRSAS